MPCHVTPPKPSLIQQLTIECSYINDLAPTQTDELLTRYWRIRQLILDMMLVAPDAYPYRQAWQSINLFGKASAQALQAGENREFDRLKVLIRQAFELVP